MQLLSFYIPFLLLIMGSCNQSSQAVFRQRAVPYCCCDEGYNYYYGCLSGDRQCCKQHSAHPVVDTGDCWGVKRTGDSMTDGRDKNGNPTNCDNTVASLKKKKPETASFGH